MLVCPRCQESGDWTADLEHCSRCGTVHLIRRLGQVECLDCGKVREPAATVASPAPPGGSGSDPALADEVGRALERLMGRR